MPLKDFKQWRWKIMSYKSWKVTNKQKQEFMTVENLKGRVRISHGVKK
jgi:hypothetical protein